MYKDLEFSVLSASPVVILRRIQLLVLVVIVMGGGTALPIYCSTSCLSPILPVKYSNKGKEKEKPQALITYCLPGSG